MFSGNCRRQWCPARVRQTDPAALSGARWSTRERALPRPGRDLVGSSSCDRLAEKLLRDQRLKQGRDGSVPVRIFRDVAWPAADRSPRWPAPRVRAASIGLASGSKSNSLPRWSQSRFCHNCIRNSWHCAGHQTIGRRCKGRETECPKPLQQHGQPSKARSARWRAPSGDQAFSDSLQGLARSTRVDRQWRPAVPDDASSQRCAAAVRICQISLSEVSGGRPASASVASTTRLSR